MQIKMVFYKSSSKYYDPCCLQCERFESYKSDGNSNVLTIDDEEIRNSHTAIASIIATAKHWSKSEFYIDGEKASPVELEKALNLLDCEKAKSTEIVGDHCFAINGWGCNYLEEISFRDLDYYGYSKKYYWYQFGFFKDDIWTIDKEKIKATIKAEANRKHLGFCRFFNIDCILAEVDKLPAQITVDENDAACRWQYKFREAAAGMRQTEIIGVEPKKEKRHIDSGISVSFGITSNSQNENQPQSEKNIPSITFNDIGGMDSIVQQVREVIELPMISPKIFEHYHLTPHKGILLYGPPGCGKTLIAKAIANEIRAHFISVNGPEILNKYLGQSEENLRKIFKEANDNTPSIIYFDEFDSLSTTRDSDDHLSSSSIVNQILTLMDGMGKNNVCCIASTNRIDMIDEAVKRPGRFDYVIEIEKPSVEGCKAIFRIHTDNMPVEKTFNKDVFVEKNLVGLTGAEIAFVVSEAAYNSIRRTIDIKRLFSGDDVLLSDNNIITEIDFIRSVKTLKERKAKAYSAQFRY